MESELPSVWCGMFISGMGRRGMYNTYEYIPESEIPDFKTFINNTEPLKALSGVKSKRELFEKEQVLWLLEDMMDSPTCCTFDGDEDSECFYVDQQGCLEWVIGDDSRVYVDHGPCVATSVQDFLTRWLIECNLFNKGYKQENLDAVEEQYQKAASSNTWQDEVKRKKKKHEKASSYFY